jgi:plastocyanin
VSPKKRLLALIAAALAALSLGLAACGDDDSSSNDTTTEAAAPATTAPATTAPATPVPATTAPATTTPAPAAAAAAVSVQADPTGQLAYVQKTLSAPAGKVTFTFTNDSPVPHDFAIESGEDELGVTKQISGGASEDLTVTLKPGEYTYYCTVPGHEAAGMKGTLTVN